MAEVRVTSLEAWRAGQAERSSMRADFADHWLGLWGSAILVAMLLYMLVGQQPFNHEAVLDPVTGVAPVSPINRIFWLGLFGLSAPIFWFRRALLVETVRRLWPLIGLLIWFAATTRWALDPGVSSKRLFLYVVQTAICVAVSLSIRNGHRMHTAMAIACAIMVGIDLFSWVFLHGRSITPLGLAAIHTHKNTLGAVMLFCGIVFGTYLVSQKTALGRGFWIGVLLAGFALLVASRSKTSLAIYVVAAMFAPLLIVYLRSRSLTMLAVAVTGSAILGSSVLAWLAWCAVQGLDPLGPLSHLTFTMRTDVWKFSLDQWAQRPWTGLGFGSFWDIDPGVQPSLQTDEWFAKPDAYTNESHNGYIDLAVTTGLIGLIGGMAVLVRWIYRSLAMIRFSLLANSQLDRQALPYGIYLGLFPLLFFAHNFMESSYFTANATFGTLILLIGVDVDLRWPERGQVGGINSPQIVRAP